MANPACKCGRCVDHRSCVGKVPLLSVLGPEQIERVASLVVRKSYRKGDIIFLEGSQLQSLVVVNSGHVKSFRYTPDGKEQILYIFSRGDFFGEMNLFRQHRLTYNVEALDDAGICLIDREDFRRLMHEHPEIIMKISQELSERLEKMETMVQNLGSNDVDARIVMMLLEFSKKYGREHRKGRLVTLPLSREGLANYIGVARETVSRKLHNLQEEGLIELVGNRGVIIYDEDTLEATV